MDATDFKMFSLYRKDFDASWEALAFLEKHGECFQDYIQQVLWHEAIVSYARPFSGNRIDRKPHRVDSSVVPDEFRFIHNEVIEYRNKLVAHSDFEQVSNFGIGKDPGDDSPNVTTISSMTYEFKSAASWSVYLQDFLSLVHRMREWLDNKVVDWHQAQEELPDTAPPSPNSTPVEAPPASPDAQADQS